jgi:hypothetical protein
VNWENNLPADKPSVTGESEIAGEIEEVIVRHCSPVLLGCKPAALFPLVADKLKRLSAFMPPGISFLIIREQENKLLAFLFNRAMLERTVLCNPVRGALVRMGYPPRRSLSVFLSHLQKRFENHKCPHEVGLFLGYPLDDVLGFIRHGGGGYKLCGVWKVYGDAEQAKSRFRQYDLCRESMGNYFKARTISPSSPPFSLKYGYD